MIHPGRAKEPQLQAVSQSPMSMSLLLSCPRTLYVVKTQNFLYLHSQPNPSRLTTEAAPFKMSYEVVHGLHTIWLWVDLNIVSRVVMLALHPWIQWSYSKDPLKLMSTIQ